MSTTNTDNAKPEPQTVEELREVLAGTRRALEAERAEHKATKTKASAIKGDEEALERLIASRLETVKAETASAAKERDEARAKLADVEGRWAGEKVDRSLSDALSRSGMIADNAADALALARPLFTLSEKGAVVTKADAAGVIPGASPDQWIIAELRAKRPHWWPKSIGGGAAGGSRPPTITGDDSCFKPGPTWNLTAQAQFERKHGTRAAETAARRYGTTPFGIGGGR